MSTPLLKRFLLAASLVLSVLTASAQSMQEFFSKSDVPLTWMGADFSGVKYSGDAGTVTAEEMVGLFEKINTLLVQEQKKYDFAGAYHRTTPVAYTPSITQGVNAKTNAVNLITLDVNPQGRFTAETVQQMVKKYAYPAGASGVGLVFVMEDLMKPTETATFWATFVDLKTKKVLYTEKLSGKALGFGFRNHWAGAIYDALKDIKAKKYGEWKKRFAKS